MAQTTLRAVIEADDRTKGTFSNLKKEVKEFSDEFKNATPKVEGTTASVLRFATGIAVGNLATLAARKVVRELGQEFQLTLQAASRYENAMIGLSSVAAAFGISQKGARDAAADLAKDGLLTVSEAAEGLKNLLASGFSMDQAIQLMKGFKDAAAFNRQGTLEFGQAIIGATQGIKNQNSIMVDNVGITKNLSVIMKEAGLSVDDFGKVSSDASVRQKLFNGLMKEAAIFSGDAERVLSSYQGTVAQTKAVLTTMREEVGRALIPMMQLFSMTALDAANTLGGPLVMAVRGVASVVIGLTTLVRLLVQSLADMANTVGAIFKSITSLSLDPFEKANKQSQENLLKIWQEGHDAIANTWKSGIGDISRSTVNTMGNMGDELSKKAKEVAQRIADETTDYKERLTQMLSDFSQSLTDLLFAHRDKSDRLKKDLSKENKDFDDSMADRKASFESEMADEEKRHKEKTENIQKDLAAERKDLQDKLDEMKRDYNLFIADVKTAGEDRIADLQAQLDKELARGKSADKEKIKMLQEMILKEKNALDNRVDLYEQVNKEEIDKEKEKHQDKISELESSLADENSRYIDAINEREKKYEEETRKIKQQHAERAAAIQEELNKELGLQAKYSSDFLTIKDKEAEDDIARLKRTYEEKKSIEEREHKERLERIKRDLEEEDAVASRASNSGQVITNAANRTTSAQAAVSKTPAPSATSQLFSTLLKPTAPAYNPQGFWQSVGGGGPWGFAEGGIVNKDSLVRVSEGNKPEAIIPLDNPRRANEIMKQAGLSGGRGVIQNITVNNINTAVDVDMLSNRLSFLSKLT